jgi:voltage-gated potassium channel
MPGFKGWLNEVIFGVDTRLGRNFDVGLIGVIIASVLAVMLESVSSVRAGFGGLLYGLEWVFTILFTVEYLVRLYCAKSPLRYATSFYGIVDLLATVPTYLSVLVPGAQFLLVVRLIRILRVFRVLKLAKYLSEAHQLKHALLASRPKITIFLFAVLSLVTILGSLMYFIEGAAHGFTSIPRGVYWAIVTLTTVGYGDISPQTPLGQTLAAVVMIMGYGIIAVPTGIVTAELTRSGVLGRLRRCPSCEGVQHAEDAAFCRRCGTKLVVEGSSLSAGT